MENEKVIKPRAQKNTSTTKPKIEKVDTEKDELKEKLKQMEAMIMQLMQTQNVNQNAPIEKTYVQEETIRADKYIKVMSLRKGTLSLTTEQRGKGKIFRFVKFGEIKSIMYQDLLLIINNQQRFAEEGYFYIMDDTVVNNAGLRDFYDNILTKETIENLLDYDRKEIVELFETAPQGQREMVVNIIIEKIERDDNFIIPYDKLDAISRIYGKDVYQIARDVKEAKQNDEIEKG